MGHTATLSFDLGNPEEKYEFLCSTKGAEACLLIENLKEHIRRADKYDISLEATLTNISEDLKEWQSIYV